jgi:hypothetical protein
MPLDPLREQEDDVTSRVCYRRSRMSLNDRIDTLRARHQSLELALQEEIHRPHPNSEMVHDIKRQKLKIKDEIYQLEHQH